MVEYGEDLLFITDKPIEQSNFDFDSPYLLNDERRRKIFDDYKESWFAVMKWHGNDDLVEEDFYECEANRFGVMDVEPYYVPKYDSRYNTHMATMSKVLIDSFGGDYVYCLQGANFYLYYETPYEHNDKFNYGRLMNECSRELFTWILEFMRDRIDSGSKVNKLVYCYGHRENLNVGFGTVNLDLDSIEVPNESYKFFREEAKKQGVNLSESYAGLILNFYKSSSR